VWITESSNIPCCQSVSIGLRSICVSSRYVGLNSVGVERLKMGFGDGLKNGFLRV
jgi:hypothetical protein